MIKLWVKKQALFPLVVPTIAPMEQKGMIPMNTASSTSERTEGQVKNFRRLLGEVLEKTGDLILSKVLKDKEMMDRFLARGNEWVKAILDASMAKARELSFVFGDQVSSWVSFYQKHLNTQLDLSGLEIPDHQDGFDRLLIVAKGLKRNQVFEACQKQFPCWRYCDDLDTAIKPDERDPKNGTYAIWVRDRQEADEENKNQSYNQRREQGCQDENILERVLHERKYFDETGKHLDIKNWTLTASLFSGGFAVHAFWGGGEFSVLWSGPSRRYDVLRARSVVSLPAEPREAVAQQA